MLAIAPRYRVPLAIGGVGLCLVSLLFLYKPTPKAITTHEISPFVRIIPLHSQSGPLLLHGNGTVTPTTQTQLASQVAGQIHRINPHLVAGGLFHRGEPLVTLDNRRYVHEQQQAHAQAQAAQANLAYAKKHYRRLQTLTRSGNATTHMLELGEQQLHEAHAKYQTASAQLKLADLNLEYSSIKAPFDGQVITKMVAVGDYVTHGTPIAKIYATDRVEITVALPHQTAALIPQLWQVTHGSNPPRIPASVQAHYGQHKYHWQGYVSRIEPGLDDKTRTVDIVVEVVNPLVPGEKRASNNAATTQAPGLLLGLYTTVTLPGEYLAHYFLVPQAALHQDPLTHNDCVWIVKHNTLSIVPVTIKQLHESTAVIVSADVHANDALIISPLPIAIAGMSVRVAKDVNS